MIRLENFSVSHGGGLCEIRSLTLSIPEGSSCALLGANGAGKSTLLSSLVGLIPSAGGIAYIGGIALEKPNFGKIRKAAGLVFQNSDDQLFCASVGEDVAFGLRNMGLAEGEIQGRVDGVLESFAISRLKGRSPQRLSEGEKKLAAICAVLAMDPRILLLDEPTGQLDARARRRIAERLAVIPQTLLIATHDLDLAAKVCKSALVLKDGELAAFGDTEKILQDAALLEECGLR